MSSLPLRSLCLALKIAYSPSPGRGGGVLYIFWVRGRAIGKGIDFHDFGIIRNGIERGVTGGVFGTGTNS